MGSFNSYLDPHLKFLKMTSVYRDIYGMKGLSTVNLRWKKIYFVNLTIKWGFIHLFNMCVYIM